MNLTIIQHHPLETAGLFEDLARLADYSISVIRPDLGQAVPASSALFDKLVIMGGPMGVYEQNIYPFLTDELRLITDSLEQNKSMLGICLGAQLIAAALGETVRRGPAKEIGWLPITLTESAATDPLFRNIPSPLRFMLWHGDIFDPPSDCVNLAHTPVAPCQAFRVNERTYGLLFHPELTAAMIDGWINASAAELNQEHIDPLILSDDSRHFSVPAQQHGTTIFQRWLNID